MAKYNGEDTYAKRGWEGPEVITPSSANRVFEPVQDLVGISRKKVLICISIHHKNLGAGRPWERSTS